MSNEGITVFEKAILPEFGKRFPNQHYTYDMFTNLVRPKDTQDRRADERYWQKKAKAGQECFAIWKEILSKFNGNVTSVSKEINDLLDRLDEWYNHESAKGLIRNPNSQGSNAPFKMAPDLDFLNRVCPEYSPWDIKSFRSLMIPDKVDNPVVVTMKKAFSEGYRSRNEQSLSLWSKDRKFYFMNRDRIVRLLTGKGIDPNNKEIVRSLLKFSDNYNESLRKELDEL